MRKAITRFTAVLVLLVGLHSASHAATFTMSYSFKIFGNPNARQVALNLADKQVALVKGDQSELDMFVEGLKRRMMSQIYRQILDDVFDPEGPKEGTYYAGNLIITVHTDDEGNTVIIVEDTITGEISIIEMGDYWGSGLFF